MNGETGRTRVLQHSGGCRLAPPVTMTHIATPDSTSWYVSPASSAHTRPHGER